MTVPSEEMTSKGRRRVADRFDADMPRIAYVCNGLRRISVDPHDKRATRMLVDKGVSYFSQTQFFVYLCTSVLDVDLYLDIGVNYGECLFSLPLHKKLRVRGYEANVYLKDHLRKSSLYNDDLNDVEVNYMAVSDTLGHLVEFFVDTRWSGKSSLSPAGNQHSKKVVVPTTTIDTEIVRCGGSSCALIKIDVEGFEPLVINGASNVHQGETDLIYMIEFDERFLRRNEFPPDKFFSDLASTFSVFELRRGGLSPVEDYEQLKRAEHIHTDLVLTRFLNGERQRLFSEVIVNTPFNESRKKFWKF